MDHSERALGRIVARYAATLLRKREAITERLTRSLSDDPDKFGLGLAADFPELEGLLALVAAGRAAEPELLAGSLLPDADRRYLGQLADELRARPEVLASLGQALPRSAHEVEPPLIAVLVGDPLVGPDDKALRNDGHPSWRIPWQQLERRLASTFADSGRSVQLEFHPATWENATRLVPRARCLVLLSHGSQDALAFETERGCALRPVSVSDDIPALFRGRAPEMVVVLACHGGAAARAIHETCSACTISIDPQEPLAWHDAVELAAGFFAAWAGGQPPEVALEQSARSTSIPDKIATFAERGTNLTPLLPGTFRHDARPAWLPWAPRPGFVAREEEVHQIVRALEEPGVVVIHGAPGNGKTELVHAVLTRARLRRIPRQGTAFVSLENCQTPAEVAKRVLAGVGDVHDTPADLVSIARALASRELLLVLDNAETVLADAEGAATLREFVQVLAAGQCTRALVTTRESPGWSFPYRRVALLALLTPKERAAILLALVREAGGDSFLTHLLAAGEALVGLTEDLGGHPLSTRIAAGRLLDGDSLESVRADLERGRHAQGSTAPTRQEDLELSLEPNRARLEPSQKEVWTLVAQLPAGIPAKTKLEESVERDLVRLKRMALVEERFGGWICLPPIRLSVLRHATPVDPERQRVSLAAVARSLADELGAAAAVFGGANSGVAFAVFGRWIENLDPLFEAPMSPEAKLALFAPAVFLARLVGLTDDAERWLGSLTWPESASTITAEAYAAQGDLWSTIDRLDDARSAYDRALGIFREIGARLGETNTLLACARTCTEEDPSRAIELARESAGLALGIHHLPLASSAFHCAGDVRLSTGDARAAIPEFLSSWRTAREADSESLERDALVGAGRAFVALQEQQVGSMLLLAAISLWRRSGEPMPDEIASVAAEITGELADNAIDAARKWCESMFRPGEEGNEVGPAKTG